MVKTSLGEIHKIKDLEYTLDLGDNGRGPNIVFNLEYNLPEPAMNVSSSCGCTTPVVISKDPFKVEVSYNGNKVGKISQWVKVKLKSGAFIKVNLTGRVN